MDDSAMQVPAGYSTDGDVLSGCRVHNPVQRYGLDPVAVIRPTDTAQLTEVIRWAQRHPLGLVPVSSRGPHGGSGISCRERHAMLDMSGWRDIAFVSRRNRVVQIEPGVSYRELQQALKAHGLTVPMPLAPRRGKSVLASCCERRPVTWSNKQWESSDPMACMEFYFGTGDRFVTGAAGGPGTLEQQRRVGQAQKAPLGPGSTDFHRLVQGSQGSLGIASWITVRAELLPSVEQPWLVGSDSLTDLYSFTYAVQRAKLGEEFFILDRSAAAMLLAAAGVLAFETAYAALPGYVGLQNVAGFERLPAQRLAYQQDDIRAMAATARLTLVPSIGPVSARAMLDAARNADMEHDWRQQQHGHCLSVVFQTTLERTHGFVELAQSVVARSAAGVQRQGLYIQPLVQNRFCEVELLYPYNPEDFAQIEAMVALERELFEALNAAHAFFARPYGYAETRVWGNNPVNAEFLRKIKHIFDPARTLNPGKFGW